MKGAIVGAVGGISILTGCSSQTLVPAGDPVVIGEVCLTPDSSNRKVVYNSTVKALQQKGFVVREVTVDGMKDCKTVLMCQSVSRWDVANFTSDISYEWYEDGKLTAHSKYHAMNGLNFSKYINT